MIRFESTGQFWYLIFIPILIGLYIRYIKWKKAKHQLLGKAHIRQHLFAGKKGGNAHIKFGLQIATILAAILALANLQGGEDSSVKETRGTDIILALDVSKSMMAKDMSPDRMSRAKLLIKSLLDNLSEDRVGLVLFAGRAYLQSPLTSDYGSVNMLLNTVSVNSAATQGTVISEAISVAEDAFTAAQSNAKTLILISDGEDHAPEALGRAKEAARNGMVIHTVGIGAPEGAPIPDPETGALKTDREGKTVISKLNEVGLRQISEATGGTYMRLENNSLATKSLLAEIQKMERRQLTQKQYLSYKSYYQYFLALALVLLALHAIIPYSFAKELNGPLKN